MIGRSLRELAERDGITPRYVRRLVDLAFLRPELVEAIRRGRERTAAATVTRTRWSEGVDLGALIEEVSSLDSPLEEDGFELTVSHRERNGCGSVPRGTIAASDLTLSGFDCSAGSRVSILQERDQRFEFGSLRRPVCLTSAFHAYRRKDPAFAGSVSLDETRERDVLASSRLALAGFL